MFKKRFFCLIWFLPMAFFPAGGFGHDVSDSSHLVITDSTIPAVYREIDSLYLLGFYNDGMEKTLLLMQHFHQSRDTAGEIRCSNLMGDFLRALGDYDNSLGYLKQSLGLNRVLQDKLLLSQTCNFLAATYIQRSDSGHYDSAAIYGRMALDLAVETGDKKLIASSLNIMGFIAMVSGKHHEALSLYGKSLEIIRQSDSRDEALILINMARVYGFMGDQKRAEDLALQSFKLSKEKKIRVYVILSSDFLREIYYNRGDMRNAFRFLGESASATNGILYERSEKRIRDMEARIRAIQTERENDRLKLEDAVNKKKLLQRRMNSILLSALVVCALIFMIIFYRQKKRLKRSNLELLARNHDIRRQKDETERLAQELDTSNATLKKFISIIAHDLKNPFNTIIGFSDLLNTEFDTLTPEERNLAIENTHKSAVSAFSLLEDLLTWARLQTGAFKMEVTTIDISDLIEEVINLLHGSALLKKQNMVKHVPANLKIRADRNMMLAVIRNLTSNAVKFTPEKGTITFSAGHSDGHVFVSVKDTGIGIPEHDIDKLFSIEEPCKRTGTNGEKGSGIGLLLCREYLEKNDGTISVSSREGEGTTFTVTLPGI